MVVVVPAVAGCLLPMRPSQPPEIVFIIPGAGPLTGGTPITISGNNFVDVVSVTVGGQDLVELSVVDSNSITGKTPPGMIGTSDVVVTTAHGSTTSPVGFRYTSRFPLLYGTPDRGQDVASAGIAADSSGNVYLAGHTDRHFPGFVNQGSTDLFAMKVDNDGALQWTQQLGTDGSDVPRGLAVDSSGNVYVVGGTTRSFPGFTTSGSSDLYVMKFNSGGARQWLQQMGTAGGDTATAVAVDSSGNVYVVGNTSGSFPGFTNAGGADMFIMKLSSDGMLQWVHQWGGAFDDSARGVATDGTGKVCVVGRLGNTQGGHLARFDSAGGQLYVKQLSIDPFKVTAGSNGDIYVAGAGQDEKLVARLDGDGTQLWAHPLGTAASDVDGVALDMGGNNVYVTGRTLTHFPGFYNSGQADMFLMKVDNGGARQWVQQAGTVTGDMPSGTVTDGEGNIFVGGSVQGFPNTEVFLMKFKPTGEMY
jgi:hypothetical protein